MTDKIKEQFASYTEVKQKMIASNEKAYNEYYNRWGRNKFTKTYSEKEIYRIVETGSLEEQKQLSRSFFHTNGLYKEFILYYATLLKYSGLLIPNPGFSVSMEEQAIKKRIDGAVNYVEKMKLPTLLPQCALNALVDGAYYGVIVEKNKKSFTVLDLPSYYCSSNFKDVNGDEIIEFDLRFFNSITSQVAREAALEAYPKVITDAYYEYRHNHGSQTVFIPTSIGVCFSCFGGRPLFLNTILDIVKLDKTLDTQHKRDLEELRKILIQKVPHLSSGALLFEPPEAAEMHDGAVQMLKGNENISVLTTYADVDVANSKTSNDTTSSSVDASFKNVYNNAGVSGEVISASGSGALKSSIQKDTAIMMVLANMFATWVSKVINDLYGNSRISFKYTIFPITEHNRSDFIDESFKLASSGFSFLLPALSLGLTQKDIVNLKTLESNVMGLNDLLQPLQSSYTQSANSDDKGGAPTKEAVDKAPSTIETQKAKENN